MASSGMLRHVALVRADVSEELSASFIRVTRICELGTTLTATSSRHVRRLLVTASVVPSSQILVTLMKEAVSSSETSVLTRATRRNNPEDTVLHFSYRTRMSWIVEQTDSTPSIILSCFISLPSPSPFLAFPNLLHSASLSSSVLCKI
jgi:hypothetical protein